MSWRFLLVVAVVVVVVVVVVPSTSFFVLDFEGLNRGNIEGEFSRFGKREMASLDRSLMDFGVPNLRHLVT